MHELPVIKLIMDICLKHAKKNDARKIITVDLKVGEMSDLEPEWMQKYFSYIAEGTIAEGCRLQIEVVPLVLRCDSCGHEFNANIREVKAVKCPNCNSTKYKIESGQKYYIDHMEVV